MANLNSVGLVLQLDSLVIPRGGHVALPKLDLHMTNFTIATRICLDSTAHRNIILGNWSANQNAWQLLFAINAGGYPSIRLRKDYITDDTNPYQDLVFLNGPLALSARQWQHVAIVFDWSPGYLKTAASLYVDGQRVSVIFQKIHPDPRLTNPYCLKSSPNAYMLGRKEDTTDDDSWFSGQLSDFRIYTRALSSAEIIQLM
jgi:hypothetical protein